VVHFPLHITFTAFWTMTYIWKLSCTIMQKCIQVFAFRSKKRIKFLIKFSNTKFNENPFSGRQVVTCMQAQRHASSPYKYAKNWCWQHWLISFFMTEIFYPQQWKHTVSLLPTYLCSHLYETLSIVNDHSIVTEVFWW
jgi:hypothetical protein